MVIQLNGSDWPPGKQPLLVNTDHLGIIDNLQAFGMTGRAGADLFIRGVGYMATGIAGGGLENTLQFLEYGFCTPKAAGGKSCRIGLKSLGNVNFIHIWMGLIG